MATSPLIDKQPGLLVALAELVHPATRAPMSLLRWTSKSSTRLAGHRKPCHGCPRARAVEGDILGVEQPGPGGKATLALLADAVVCFANARAGDI